MNDVEKLKFKAQIDHLKILAAIIRKYGVDGEIVITRQDLIPVRGGIKREVDDVTGALIYRFVVS